MTSWTNNIQQSVPCAIVPPSQLSTSRDVLSMTNVDPKTSDEPFGISVHTVTNYGSHIPMDIMFVSEQAAQDRSPQVSPLNGHGVKAGWYIEAKPGTKYVVKSHRVSSKSSYEFGRFETHFSIGLKVDGLETNDRYVYHLDEYQHVVTWNGFVKSVNFRPDNTEKSFKTYDEFMFSKLDTSCIDEESTTVNSRPVPNELGSICFSVKVGSLSPADKHMNMKYNSVTNGSSVGEKFASKNGITLRTTKGDEKCVPRRSLNYTHVRSRDLPRSGITIYVRNRSWLSSRKIIDQDGNPCTFKAFEALKRLHIPSTRPTKRVKIEHDTAIEKADDSTLESIINVDEDDDENEIQKIPEFIDLTSSQ